jgi:peptidoglycan/xylan/chitin deacetylase (PgdA/CDA1 family)
MVLNDKFKNRLLSAALYSARLLGVFALAQLLTRRRLRILCYHGFSLVDEHEVMPHVFMRKGTFVRRMQILQRRSIPVIALDEALTRLKAGKVGKAETVITFDDGWASNVNVAAPVLEAMHFPACIYVTTEHLEAGTEVFNVVLYYMLCRTSRSTLKLEGLDPAIDGSYSLEQGPGAVHRSIVAAAERLFPALIDRQRLLVPISTALGFDLGEILGGDRFRLMHRGEMQAMHRRGFDIELHTHTHRLPAGSFEQTQDEIVRNRRALAEVLGVEKNHLCYPSGEYSPQQLEWLPRLGIVSATTCEPGLNGRTTDILQLRRYLDSDAVEDISFEAEICGLREVARIIRRRLSVSLSRID